MTKNGKTFVSSSVNSSRKRTFLLLFFFSPRLIFVRVRFVDRQGDRLLIVVVVEHFRRLKMKIVDRSNRIVEETTIGRRTNRIFSSALRRGR